MQCCSYDVQTVREIYIDQDRTVFVDYSVVADLALAAGDYAGGANLRGACGESHSYRRPIIK